MDQTGQSTIQWAKGALGRSGGCLRQASSRQRRSWLLPKINPSYLGRVLRLTLLAPDHAERILDGTQPPGHSWTSC
jgi:hypothetical protein